MVFKMEIGEIDLNFSSFPFITKNLSCLLICPSSELLGGKSSMGKILFIHRGPHPPRNPTRGDGFEQG